jgi:hypothetical protein
VDAVQQWSQQSPLLEKGASKRWPYWWIPEGELQRDALLLLWL